MPHDVEAGPGNFNESLVESLMRVVPIVILILVIFYAVSTK
jgi:hypothetical protein